jgi:hypothetical protein
MRLLTEAELDYLETFIPELAAAASQQAYVDTLAAGYPVMEVVDGMIVLTEPSGARQPIGPAKPKTRVQLGVIHVVKSRAVN